MQYKVPQDVQREDTIIGPITLRQLIILAIGGGIAYAIYISLARTYFIEIWLPPVAIVSAITLAFAFLKVHSLPFHRFLLNLLEYYILPRRRLWMKGSGDVFISSFMREQQKNKKVGAGKKIKEKKTRNLDELVEILDAKGAIANSKRNEAANLAIKEKNGQK